MRLGAGSPIQLFITGREKLDQAGGVRITPARIQLAAWERYACLMYMSIFIRKIISSRFPVRPAGLFQKEVTG